ncbi:MAG: PilZ domain-containing protein [Planctomycetota bacterium]|nr:PilZ domain-containing protein [Planctomycetota bacterium]
MPNSDASSVSQDDGTMEKREQERVSLTFPVRVRIDDINQFVEQHSTDLSEGGIFIRMNYPPPAGSKVDMSFYLEPVHKTILARGEVVRSVPDAKGGDGPTGMAVRFTDLGKDGRRFIELVVQKFNCHHPSQLIELPADFLEEVDGEIRGVSEELPPHS